MNQKNPYAGIRWFARISGLLVILLSVIIGIGSFLEGLNKNPATSIFKDLTPVILVMFILWGLGLAGLLVGWWKEKLGGIVSFCCFILIAVMNIFNAQAPTRAGAIFPMLLFCTPSIFFITYWWLNREKSVG